MIKAAALIFIFAFAQTPQVMNEVLFSVSGTAATSFDRQTYTGVLNEVFQKKSLSTFSRDPASDFLLSRLADREARIFDLPGEKPKISESARKKLSDLSAEEIDNEAGLIARALALVEIKEAQLKQQERFDTWFELLKRKYQLKIKTTDSK